MNPDVTAIKRHQQRGWASGDCTVAAGRSAVVAERLCDAADLHAGWRVVDVATGCGNAAIAAARLGCDVVGVDYVPALLERARRRMTAEGLAVELVEGDAEALPFPDDSFDAVISVFGAMFAADHEQAAAELVRVCRPGGTIALASWSPGSFVDDIFTTLAAHTPQAGVPSPTRWGDAEYLRRLLGDRVAALTVDDRTFTFRFRSAEQVVTHLRQSDGPTLNAFATLDDVAGDALELDLIELVHQHDRLRDGAVAVPAVYTEAIAVVR